MNSHLLYIVLIFWLVSPVFSQTTYYIRTDGGTASQCNGRSDAAYSGSGSNQPCAWSHPFWALDSNGNWKISGGDTIIISPGSYKMGYGAPNTNWCDPDGAFDCHLPPLPSGPDANHPTRILGAGWNSGCASKPELWGSQRPWFIIDLTDSSNVYIACLEITDHSGCVESHSNNAVECVRDDYPFGDWAAVGIYAEDSANVTLKDLNIHGLASGGVHAGRLRDWTVQNVRIAGNGWSGWDGDIDGNDSNSGTIYFNNVTVEWNGCGESYPDEAPHNCWGQSAGGYGDGLGTGTTGGDWVFDDCVFRYNTSDGLDLLYTRNSGSSITVRRLMSYGNAGNPLKVTGNARIENSLLVSNCGYFEGQSFTYFVDNCRALGNALELHPSTGATISVVNSTIAGQGDCLVAVECDDCDGSETVIMQNNIFQGYREFLDPSDTACFVWFDRGEGFYNTLLDYNILYEVKMGDMALAAHDLNQNPLFVNNGIHTFDGHLRAGSPAIDSGLAVGGLNGLVPADDIGNGARPVGAGVDRGAYEYGAVVLNPLPFGEFATPVNGSVVRGSTAVTGWALDDVEVKSVKIYRELGGQLIFIGNAVFSEGSRPDVESAYPGYPFNDRAGWGYMLLSNFLPGGGNGAFTLHAIARDGAGNGVDLGTKTIVCDNAHAVKPFGAIDTPEQGGRASGKKFYNWGWALTPPPNRIPTDGSTIDVWIDGQKVGKPVYNLFREDVAGLFPGYANSNGAVGYFIIDTTKYADGVHTIQWTVTDNAGNTDGIGSRYFIIRN